MYEDDDSKATKKQNSKHDQAVSNLFRQCGFQEQPRRRRACRIVIRLGSVRRHVRIAMRDLYWSADRSGGLLGICGGDASPVSSGKRRGAEVQTPVCSDEVQFPGKRRSAEVQIPVCSDEV